MLDALQRAPSSAWMLNFWHTRSLIMHRDEAHPRDGPHGARGGARGPRAHAWRATPRRSAAAATPRSGADVFAQQLFDVPPDGRQGRRRDGPGSLDGASSADAGAARRHPRAEPIDRAALRDLSVERTSGDPLVGRHRRAVADEHHLPAGTRRQATPSGAATSADDAWCRSRRCRRRSSSRSRPTTWRTCSHFSRPRGPSKAVRTRSAEAIATALLDEQRDQKSRETLARDAAPRAVDVVHALVAGCPTMRPRSTGVFRGSGGWPSRPAARRTRPLCAAARCLDAARAANGCATGRRSCSAAAW